MQCIKCAQQLTRTKKGVNCSTCDGMFHVSCGQISEALFKSIENGSSDWRCLSCRNTNNRKSIINMGDDASNASGIAIASSNEADDFNYTIQQMSNNIKSLTENYKASMDTMNGMNNQLIALQSIAETVNNHEAKIKSLEGENRSMKTALKIMTLRIDNMEQGGHHNKLQFNNVPCVNDNNLFATVSTIASKLNITLNPEDIVDMRKLTQPRKPDNASGAGHNSSSSSSSSIVEPPPSSSIVTTFRATDVRNNILASYRKLPNRELYFDNNKNYKIYVNEFLSSNRRRLLQKAKLFGKDNGYKYIWVKNGDILMRKQEGSKVVHVNSFTDFASIEEVGEKRSAYSV